MPVTAIRHPRRERGEEGTRVHEVLSELRLTTSVEARGAAPLRVARARGAYQFRDEEQPVASLQPPLLRAWAAKPRA